jgi:hypothetical protein
MAGPKLLATGTKSWPEQASSLPVDDVVKLYEAGFAGCVYQPDERAAFRARAMSDYGTHDGSEIAQAAGWAESGAGKLNIPFVFVLKYFPGCLPGAAQERGDCVSHGVKNAVLTTLACDIASGKPDQETGKMEGVPEIPPAGVTEGALSTEWFYWFRGYSGDGWSCDAAANVAIEQGIMLRKPYPELGIDLTNYSGSLAGKYGRSEPPAPMQAEGAKHIVRGSVEIDGFETLRDFMANGYGINGCGGEGWSSQRDENGFSKQSGRWSHSMAVIGADDRDIIKQKYGEPLILIQNSWGKFNTGGRRILGTQVDIPEGSFWAKWSDCDGRYHVAHSSVNGWPAKTLPPFQTILG